MASGQHWGADIEFSQLHIRALIGSNRIQKQCIRGPDQTEGEDDSRSTNEPKQIKHDTWAGSMLRTGMRSVQHRAVRGHLDRRSPACRLQKPSLADGSGQQRQTKPRKLIGTRKDSSKGIASGRLPAEGHMLCEATEGRLMLARFPACWPSAGAASHICGVGPCC